MGRRPDQVAQTRRTQRGEVSTLIVFPLAVLSFMFCAHAALVFHGRAVVAGAAQDGLRAAQIEGGDSGDAVTAGTEILRLAPGLQNPAISVSTADGGDRIAVTATAQVTSIIPGLLTDVRSVATGPRERFYDEDERER